MCKLSNEDRTKDAWFEPAGIEIRGSSMLYTQYASQWHTSNRPIAHYSATFGAGRGSIALFLSWNEARISSVTAARF